MEHIRQIHCMKSPILFIIMFFAAFDVAGQKFFCDTKHRLEEPYYQMLHFSNDSLAYNFGNGCLVKGRVLPFDYEEGKCEALSNFHVEMNERCHWSRIHDSTNEFVHLTVRCQFLRELNFITLPQKSDFLEVDSKYCISACDEFYFSVEGDYVATMQFDEAPNISVYQLKIKDHRAYLGRFLGTTDRCGVFEMDIPADRDSYYCFYQAEAYVFWIHFFASTSAQSFKRSDRSTN